MDKFNCLTPHCSCACGIIRVYTVVHVWNACFARVAVVFGTNDAAGKVVKQHEVKLSASSLPECNTRLVLLIPNTKCKVTHATIKVIQWYYLR